MVLNFGFFLRFASGGGREIFIYLFVLCLQMSSLKLSASSVKSNIYEWSLWFEILSHSQWFRINWSILLNISSCFFINPHSRKLPSSKTFPPIYKQLAQDWHTTGKKLPQKCHPLPVSLHWSQTYIAIRWRCIMPSFNPILHTPLITG